MLTPVSVGNKSLADYTHLAGRPLVEEIRELAKEKTPSDVAMSGECVPIKGRFVGEPMTKRVDAQGGVKVKGAHATKKPSEVVDGVEVFKPDRYTAYA